LGERIATHKKKSNPITDGRVKWVNLLFLLAVGWGCGLPQEKKTPLSGAFVLGIPGYDTGVPSFKDSRGYIGLTAFQYNSRAKEKAHRFSRPVGVFRVNIDSPKGERIFTPFDWISPKGKRAVFLGLSQKGNQKLMRIFFFEIIPATRKDKWNLRLISTSEVPPFPTVCSHLGTWLNEEEWQCLVLEYQLRFGVQGEGNWVQKAQVRKVLVFSAEEGKMIRFWEPEVPSFDFPYPLGNTMCFQSNSAGVTAIGMPAEEKVYFFQNENSKPFLKTKLPESPRPAEQPVWSPFFIWAMTCYWLDEHRLFVHTIPFDPWKYPLSGYILLLENTQVKVTPAYKFQANKELAKLQWPIGPSPDGKWFAFFCPDEYWSVMSTVFKVCFYSLSDKDEKLLKGSHLILSGFDLVNPLPEIMGLLFLQGKLYTNYIEWVPWESFFPGNPSPQ